MATQTTTPNVNIQEENARARAEAAAPAKKSKKAKGAKPAKAAKKAAAPKAEKKVTPAEPKQIAYPGFCIATGFESTLKDAQESFAAARAKDKDGNFRFAIYTLPAVSKDDAIKGNGVNYPDTKGFAIAAGFDRSLVKAEKLLAKANKHGNFKLFRVLPSRDHGKGTKQAKLAAKGGK